MAAVVGLLAAYSATSFQLRERKVNQIRVGMSLAEVSALLGQGRPSDAFASELSQCPPSREALIFDGNANLVLNGAWEDYVKVGAVDGVVCDVTRMSL